MIKSTGMMRGMAVRLGLSRPVQKDDAMFASPSRKRIMFFHTIRWRLTIWYITVIVAILAITSLIVSTTVQQGLDRDIEDRLHQAAEQINSETQAQVQVPGRIFTGETIDTPQLAEIIAQFPDIANLVLSGIWVTYTQPDGTQFIPATKRSVAGSGSDGSSIQDASSARIIPLGLFNQVDTATTLQQGVQVYQTVNSGDLHARVLVYPIIYVDDTTDPTTESTQVIGSIIVGTQLDQMRSTMALVNRALLLIGVGGSVLAVFFGWLVAGRALAPVKKITSTAQDITSSSESLAMRLEEPRTADELDLLATTFNSMLSRIEDSFNAQRRFVADASHELRTPLTSIRGNVEVLMRQVNAGHTVSPEVLREALGDVHRESGRMARLIADLLTLARSDATRTMETVHPEVVSLDVLAMEAYRTLEPLAGETQLLLKAGTPVAISGDGDRLVQVMIILGENAIRHTPAGGTVTLEVERVPGPEGESECARVTVRDTGIGIAEEHLLHLFDRFYRVAGSRGRESGGTGLGLSIALGIVRAHGGWIDVETAVGKGSNFLVYLPL